MDKNIKKILSVVVFVIVTFYCMITGWWIFWAGITAMLYIDALVDSTREWSDVRQMFSLNAMKEMKSPESLQQSVLRLEERVNALEQERQ
jgi:hypothetical protein